MNRRTVEADSSRTKYARALILVGSLALSAVQAGCAIQPAVPVTQPVVVATDPPAAQASQGNVPVVTRSAEQLDQLVAPIALYPDELVAQILAASTYPAEVVEAERWMQANSALKGDALAKAVNTQPWDDSVKALVQFPSVLAMLDKNLSWSSSLGEAYESDSKQVMDAVQKMRERAQHAGNLKSTPQENVTNQGQTIVIEPANPEVVYVPEYDPWLIYGDPLAFYPGWVGFPGLFIGGPGIDFGLGFGIGVFGGFGWGWHHWGADWGGHGIFHNHAPWHSHSPTFGGHSGPGGFGHPGGFAGAGGHSFGTHSSAFSGFNHGGIAHGFAARGRASAGGFHGGGGGHR